MKQLLSALFLLLCSTSLLADASGVYAKTVNQGMDATYKTLYQALEAKRFWVVFEPDMGSRMRRMADKWGDDYNRNGLEEVKSMVFCNIAWTNRVANADPDLLALCPLHVTLYSKQGQTTITLPRPSVIAQGSVGEATAAQLDEELVEIIETAFRH